ncbi:hypothetical protein CHS0354_022145 [Potamilus streckersoni]|uniref:Uncharacterized protein n=1 Tax=Potamilus streckersoni TaxID=2493646 RepID=A0AAE0RT93_9BIVA|nr:hypothetical protein CHS0354_022145 [Potamilus streckersoni]
MCGNGVTDTQSGWICVDVKSQIHTYTVQMGMCGYEVTDAQPRWAAMTVTSFLFGIWCRLQHCQLNLPICIWLKHQYFPTGTKCRVEA